MKNFFLWILLVSTIFSISIKTNATTTDVTSPIFKIHAYSYDKVSDIYTFEQYGSAVLIANNLLLTNAHVIADENNEINLQYEACQTVFEDKKPVCFSTLQLLRYDKINDLALLQIVNPNDTMPVYVTMWSGTVQMWVTVRVVGYPANGGSTITTTQWTIAWFENGLYKTDANIDNGNSGWGTFNADWEFIGIPTFVVKGQTTLGYVIPTSVIKNFVGGTSGISYKPKYSLSFDKQIKSLYALQTAWMIDNNLFATPDFATIGLTLDNALEKKVNNLYHYSLYNENDSVVKISSYIATNDAAISTYTNNTVKYLHDNDYTPKKTSKIIEGVKWNVLSFGDDTLVGYYYIQASSKTKTYLKFIVFVDKEDIGDLPGLVSFIEGITIKKSYTKPKVLNLPVVKLSSKWNISIVKWIDENGLSVNVFPQSGRYSTEIWAYIGAKWDTLKSIVSQIKETYHTMWLSVASEISKYPNSVSIMSIVDENNTSMLSIFGVKKYGKNNVFIHISSELNSTASKQEAIQLAYKILGLQ